MLQQFLVRKSKKLNKNIKKIPEDFLPLFGKGGLKN